MQQAAIATEPMPRLRAEVIRALCVESAPNEKIEAKRISISGATIVGVLDLEGLEISYPLRLINCVLEERPNFTNTKLKLLDLSGTRCVKGIDAAYLEVATKLILGEDFSAGANVCLYEAKIQGNLDCTGGHFADHGATAASGGRLMRPALDAEGVEIGGSALLTGGFTAEGEVRLSSAKIRGVLDCSGGRFTSCGNNPALSAIGVDIGGSAFLRERFSAQGEVSLYEAKIGGNLDCGNSSFMNPGATALNATGARVGGFFTWREVATSGRIILEHASVNQLADQAASWPARGDLFLDGFEYKGFAGEAPRDASNRLGWLKRQSEFTPQPYEHLITVLRRIGLEDDARKVAIEKQERLQKSNLLPWTSRAWNRFVGFNTPGRALVYALFTILFGWVVFSAADWVGIMIPAKETTSAAQVAPLGNNRLLLSNSIGAAISSLGYSLDVFLPAVNLHQEDQWSHDRSTTWGLVCWAYSWVHALLGLALTAILVAALGNLVRKD